MAGVLVSARGPFATNTTLLALACGTYPTGRWLAEHGWKAVDESVWCGRPAGLEYATYGCPCEQEPEVFDTAHEVWKSTAGAHCVHFGKPVREAAPRAAEGVVARFATGSGSS